ncbi:MAG: FAD-binding oxidoreductase [Acidobacteriota bacterium]|nr:FAD-binding oxidoreductase [Acidobacteriota bacterium]
MPQGSIAQPSSPEELAEALVASASRKHSITLAGGFSKRLMAGPIEPSDSTISTAGMRRILKYEPRDLTISVEAGVTFADLSRVLALNRQMIPLDPPFSESATIGGILAANTSGPRRRLHGTARDFVIGMKFATLEGKLVQSGGMVVKNVAGLDMGKLMIGSFGTLAAIAVANFKILPAPTVDRTFLLSFDTLDAALKARDVVLLSVLQPAAVDLLNPSASARAGSSGYLIALQFGGNEAVIGRCQRELSTLGDSQVLSGDDEARFWERVRDFTPHFLAERSDGAVVRVSCTLSEIRDVVASLEGPALARAGSGVCYGYFDRPDAAAAWMNASAKNGWKAVMEFAPETAKADLSLWPAPGGDFEMMKKVKHMFDPHHLLNRGRLYHHL